MNPRPSLIALLALCGIALTPVAAAAAQPTAPSAGYTINEEYTEKSPDGAITIEQYVNKTDDDWKWQFWARQKSAFTLLDKEPAGYPAGFLFTRDLKWIVRGQKTGSGELSLYLYRVTPQGTSPAARKPLGDRAWDYFKRQPDWRRIKKAPEYHITAGLVEGSEDNYRSLGVDWPDNRYLVITLSGDADVKGRRPEQTLVVNGWRCRYDLQTGQFDTPAIFATDNKKALVPE